MASGVKYAAKVVQKASLTKKGIQRKLESEIAIHERLKSRYIVPFEKKFEDADHVYIILGLCENNSLMEMMRTRKRLTEPEVQVFGLQLLEGLRYLHEEQRVIHRDLKLGNLFLTRDMEIRIGDFGLAACIENDEDRRKTVCGTPNYIAPEVLDSGKNDGHSFEVDIWSFGVVLYTLLVGKPPFETGSVKDTYKKIRSTSFSFPESPVLSEPTKALITSLLRHDPNGRPGIHAIKSHAFFHNAPGRVPVEALRQDPRMPVVATARSALPPLPTPQRATAATTAATPYHATAADVGMDGLEARFTSAMRFNSSPYPVPSPALATAPPRHFSSTGTPREPVFVPYDDASELRSLYAHLTQELACPGSDRSRRLLVAPRCKVLKWHEAPQWGFGYLLTIGVLGIRFNDSTAVAWVLNAAEATYTDEKNRVALLTVADETLVPGLRKKMRLIKTFFDFVVHECTAAHVLVPAPDPGLAAARLHELPLVHSHIKTKNAVIFRLNDGSTQFVFYDRSMIHMAAGSAAFDYRSKDGVVECTTLADAHQAGRKDVSSRLSYIRTTLGSLIGAS